jgi:hypothetical protein
VDGATSPRIAAGRWYIAVVHADPTAPASYSFRAQVVTGCFASSTPISAGTSSFGPGGFTLRWNGDPSEKYRVQYTDSISPPDWKTFDAVASSSDGYFEFLDDGSTSGGINAQRFYRLVRVE